MKKFALAGLLILSLSACVQSWAKESMQQERQLWVRVGEKAVHECSAWPMTKPETRMKADECVSGIVRSTVMPYATYPDLVARLIADQSGVSRRFANREIDLARANAEAKQLQARYQAEVYSRLSVR